ncbi:MAG: ASCH domain-containing protein [Verrucomicrobiota bacterium]
MKAITLMQPWATLVAIGIKRIETRGWRTDYRGPIAIHAAKRFPRRARELCEQPAFRYALRGVRTPLPLGCVLCTCQLREIHLAQDLTSQTEFPFLRGDDLLTQFQFGDFADGRFAWMLSDVNQINPPIAAKGALSFWEWTA